ncbi:MAG: hypothetical protein KAR05_03390 [Candidatus Omnitrophica bacterium]|nr:hypothetical protein [Candidatus Omnitrophota bacterium]
MFRLLRKNIQNVFRKNSVFSFSEKNRTSLKNTSGQVGVVLILIAALALIIYAAVMNMGRVSRTKTIAVMAANASAGHMVSLMASYGERIFQEVLGGRQRICGMTGVLKAIFTIVIVIIAIIITIASAGTATFVALKLVCLGLALILSVASLVVQLTIVQPGITTLWNKMMAEALSIEDMLIERGILMGLQNSITDQVYFPDLHDIDQDLNWETNAAIARNEASDYVSRFAYYYTDRLRTIIAPPVNAIQFFQQSMACFLYADPGKCNIDCGSSGMNVALCNDLNAQFSTWGLLDPVDCVTSAGIHPCCPGNFPSLPADFPLDMPSECNPCCVSDFGVDILGVLIFDGREENLPVMPPCCNDPGDPQYPCGNPALCVANTPYDKAGEIYEEIYDSAYEDHTNGFYSFRELLGRDDEHHLYRYNPTDPAYFDAANPDRLRLTRQESTVGSSIEGLFRLDDVSGYYKTPIYAMNYDLRPGLLNDNYPAGGIFQLFHKIADWGTELSPLYLDYTDDQCVYCDVRSGVPCILADIYPEMADDDHDGINSRLELPNILGDAPFSGDWCLDEANTGAAGDPPQLADKVPMPAGLIADDDTCAADPLGEGGWKRGADRFCSDVYPYEGNCPKHRACYDDASWEDHTDPYSQERRLRFPYLQDVPYTCDCGVGGTDPAEYPEDSLDEIVYGLSEFYSYAETLLDQNLRALVKTTKEWYKIASSWLEAPCVNVNTGERLDEDMGAKGGACPFSFVKGNDGTLWVWRYEIYRFWWRIFYWIYAQAPPFDLSPPYGMGVNEGFPHPGFYPAGMDTKDLGIGVLPNPYVADSCNEMDVWCVPPEQAAPNEYGVNECPYVTPTIGFVLGEADSFNYVPAAGDWIFDDFPAAVYNEIDPTMFTRSVTDEFDQPSRGDLFDVVSCLNWQVNDERTYPLSGLAPAIGNAQKFQRCFDALFSGDSAGAAEACLLLPRCLVPGADAILFQGMDFGNAGASEEIMRCLVSADVIECNYYCAGLPAFVPPVFEDPPPPSLEPGSCAWFHDPSDPLYNTIFFDAVTNALTMTQPPYNLGSCHTFPGTPLPSMGDASFRPAVLVARDATDPDFNELTPDPVASALFDTCYNSANMAECRANCNNSVLPQEYRTSAGLLVTLPAWQWPADPAHEAAFDACFNITPDLMVPPPDPAAIADCITLCSPAAMPFGWAFDYPYLLPIWDQPYEEETVLPENYFSCAWLIAEPEFTAAEVALWHDSTWYDSLVESLELTQGSFNPSGAFLATAEACMKNAENQVAKFKKRFLFLQARLKEALRAMLILHDGWKHFTAFLDGNSPFNTASPAPFDQDSPMETMVQARFNYEDTKGTASVVVYVWQDEDLEDDELRADGSSKGFWHAVKVEVRAPGRCNNACGYWPVEGGPDSVGGPDPEWPRVDSYTKDWGTSRCYELVSTEGMVKVRVIRFDESEEVQGVITFPDDSDLWEIRDYNPAADELSAGEVAGVEGACRPLQLLDGSEWGYAFMLNYSKYSIATFPHAITDAQWGVMALGFSKLEYINCWNYVHEHLLPHGVVEESCAAYFFDEGEMGELGYLVTRSVGDSMLYANQGMRLKFVPCDGAFLSGAN